MGYRISKVCRLKGPQFKIRYEWFEGAHRQSRDVPKSEWATLGFRTDMTLYEANVRKDSLNAKGELSRHEAKRQAIAARMKGETLAQAAYLPVDLIEEFETHKLLGRTRHPDDKTSSYWTVAKRALCELRVDPKDWAEDRTRFYDYFGAKQYSPAYVQKLIQVLNRWGKFISRKQGAYFDPLPYPEGRERNVLARLNRKRTKRPGNKASAPLSPQLLESKRSKLKPEHYAALYLTVWLGLRPEEVSFLKDPKKHRIEESDVPVVWIYQQKIEDTVGEDKAWKPIPLFRPEMLTCLEIIESGAFTLPRSKAVVSHFGTAYGLYAGRKGFTDLMLSLGQDLADVSVWMGHTSIERTWASYKNKQRVHFKKAA